MKFALIVLGLLVLSLLLAAGVYAYAYGRRWSRS